MEITLLTKDLILLLSKLAILYAYLVTPKPLRRASFRQIEADPFVDDKKKSF